MSESTKTYRWLPWTVALFAALLIVALGMYYRSVFLDINPGSLAHRVIVINAIEAFSDGIPVEQVPWEYQARALTGLVLLFIVGPSLWLFSEIRNHAKPEPIGDEVLKKGADWYLGVTITGFALMLLIPHTTQRMWSFSHSTDYAGRIEIMDRLRLDLSKLAFDAAELYYLPHRLGGGAGSFRTIAANGVGEEPRPIRLEDISERVGDSPFRIDIDRIVTDSLITLYGVADRMGEDPDFENLNGERGRIQLVVKVDPEGQLFTFDKSLEN